MSIDQLIPQIHFINTNINGTYELLKISLNYYLKIKKKNFKFYNVSTDEVFGSLKDEGFINEETPYNPSSPYSASKASSDHLVRSWFSTYSLPILITNCSNIMVHSNFLKNYTSNDY